MTWVGAGAWAPIICETPRCRAVLSDLHLLARWRPDWLAGVAISNYGIHQDRNPFELPRNLPDLAQGIVQRRFQDELRVREPAAAAADRVHRRSG